MVLSLVLSLLFLASPAFVAGYSSVASSNNSNPASSSSSYSVAPGVLSAGPGSEQPSCSPSALCPSMLRTAYGFSKLFQSGVNGTGQTVVIVDACGYSSISSDLQTFDSQFHLPNPKFNVIDVEGKITNSTCESEWSVETALDVEWAHVVAPGASIDLLLTVNAGAQAMYDAWTYSLDHNLGNQISNSWGGAGCGVKGCNNTIGEGIGPCTLTNGTQGVHVTRILSEAAKQNVTILAAAGDYGAWGIDHAEEMVPADCPGVLTIGGTALIVQSDGKYVTEIGWSGSGGGYVTAPKEPSYQKEAKIKDKFGTLAKPDVAADASCSTPVWVYVEGSWDGICGTSVATPLWSGFMADVNQIRADNGFSPAGFVNPFLYTVVYTNSTLYKNDFHDIKTGSNGWTAGKGWDPVTGLGSFVAPNLAQTLGDSKNA